jgi:hypothetical protein
MNAAEKRQQMAELARIEAKKRADVAEIARQNRPSKIAAAYEKAKLKAVAEIQKQLRGNSVEVGYKEMEREVQDRLTSFLVGEGYKVQIHTHSWRDSGHDQGEQWYDNGIVTSTIFTIRW